MPRMNWTGSRWLAVAAALHLAVGAASGLSVDEAHYALYALHPALSYFDHPPLVGWVQIPFAWLSVGLGGLLGHGGPWLDGLWLRVVPVAAWVGALALLQVTAREMGLTPVERNWLWAVSLAAPMWHLLGFGLVPDTLLLPLAAALVGWLWRMREPDVAAQWSAWLILGLLLGLAGLAKYTAVLLVPGVLWVLWRSHGWALLRGVGPWLGLAVALLCISPVLVWNAQNGWASFAYQAAHGAGSAGWRPAAFGLALAAQVLVFGPVLALGVVAALARAKRLPASGREVLGFCTALALPTLLLLLALSGRGGSLPHWTSVGWLLMAPVAALVLAGLRGAWRRVAQASVVLQGLACLAVLLAIGGGARGPLADFHGWKTATQAASQAASSVAAPAASARLGDLPLAVQNWTLASRAAWYAHPRPVVVLDTRQDQFDLWFGGPKAGQSAVLLEWSGMPFELPVRGPGKPGGFAACEPLGKNAVERLGRELAQFAWWRCTDWQGSAAPQRRQTLALPPGGTR